MTSFMPHLSAPSFCFKRWPEGRMIKPNGRKNTLMKEWDNKLCLGVSFLQDTICASMSTSRLTSQIAQHFISEHLGCKKYIQTCIHKSVNEHPNSHTWADNGHGLHTPPVQQPPVVTELWFHYTHFLLLMLLSNMLIINYTLDQENAVGRNSKSGQLHNYPDG